MEIVLKSNKSLFYINQKFEQFEVRLNSKLGYNIEQPITITLENTKTIQFMGVQELRKFSDEIRGKNKESFLYTAQKNKLNRSNNFDSYIENLNDFSFNTFKSFFLLYNWIEIPLLNQDYDELSIEKNLYDEFVIDWTSKPESQKDIYLIKKEHINKSNTELLEHLEKLNLLCSLSIFPYKNETLITYFTPLNQPGISKSYFEYIDKNNQRKNAYPFWKKIIEERNQRISNWINNRY